jgi:hypothetical protein
MTVINDTPAVDSLASGGGDDPGLGRAGSNLLYGGDGDDFQDSGSGADRLGELDFCSGPTLTGDGGDDVIRGADIA